MSKIISIYQTLSDKGKSITEEEKGGPYPSIYKRENSDIKNPWLTDGYYFWDGSIEAAHVWGEKAKEGKYIIGESQYDLHCDSLFDVHGDPEHDRLFWKIAEFLKKKLAKKDIKSDIYVKDVVNELRRNPKLSKFKAIRMLPHQSITSEGNIRMKFVQGHVAYIEEFRSVQLCVWVETDAYRNVIKDNKDFFVPDKDNKIFRIIFPKQ